MLTKVTKSSSEACRMTVSIPKDRVTVASLGSCCVFSQQRKQVDESLYHIHSILSTGQRHFLPESMSRIINKDAFASLKQRVKELSPSTTDGLIYLALGLGVSLNLDVSAQRPDNIMFDTCVILSDSSPMVLSISKQSKRVSEAERQYNFHLTKSLIADVRQYTDEHFSALFGVMTTDDLLTQKAFKEAYGRIKGYCSIFCIPNSLSMSEEKYEKITKAFFAVAASTNVVNMTESDEDSEDDLWFLTKEQFHVLSENIDENEVTVSAEPGTGCTVLILEVANRLEKAGRTLLVTRKSDLCKVARKRKLCSKIMTSEEFEDRMQKSKSLPRGVRNVVSEEMWSAEGVKLDRAWYFNRIKEKRESLNVESSPNKRPKLTNGTCEDTTHQQPSTSSHITRTSARLFGFITK